MKISAPLFLLFNVFYACLSAQTPEWSTSVASIIFANCSGCHHEGGIAPFALMDYDDAVNNAFSMQADVNAGKMPPWPPDPSYNHFSGEKILSESEITTINSWVNGGMPSGDLSLAPAPPVFNGGSLMNIIDDTIIVPSYTVLTDLDEFRTFVVHSNFSETKYLNQIEFVPNDFSAVHHVFLFQDSSDLSYQADLEDTMPGFYANGFGISSPYAKLVGGWVPGAQILSLPADMGFEIPPGADFVVAFHYAPGSLGKTVNMKINLKFSDSPNVRGVEDRRLLYWTPPVLLNPPFKIPANQVVTFYEENSMSANKSLVAIQPHMHLLGKSFKVYMVTEPGDTTNLLWIPQWYFSWQMDYFLTKIIKIPSDAQIIGEGTYDNTSNNPSNPNNPPIDVYAGETTSDEMMGCHFSLLDYLPGDENIILDSSFYIATSSATVNHQSLGCNVFPNPASDYLHFTATLSYHEIEWILTNEYGTVITSDRRNNIPKGAYAMELNVSDFSQGVYFLKIRSGDQQTVTKVLVIK